MILLDTDHRTVLRFRSGERCMRLVARMEAASDAAAIRFQNLRQSRIRIGTNDLKIAAIALTAGSLLLTANRQDFELVPGLRFANWLD